MKSISILYHQEPEGWWAESQAIPGWTAVGGTLDEVREQVSSAIQTFVGPGVAVVEEGLPVGGDLPSPKA